VLYSGRTQELAYRAALVLQQRAMGFPNRSLGLTFPLAIAGLVAACSDAAQKVAAEAGVDDGITHRSDVTMVTRVEDAKPGVFIPPFEECKAPLEGETTSAPGGKVCTNVAISGATEAGKKFARYASCDVVLTQRPYYARPPANESRADDPRLQDATLLGELAWAKSQIEASGCVCCHDSSVRGASQWDIAKGPLWLDSLSDGGLALFAGFADSSVLGAYPADKNHGFDRTSTGIPTTDTARMQKLIRAELTRRGITEAAAKAVPPFGGPIYANSVRPPEQCGANVGIDMSGNVYFPGGAARYVYVLEPGSKNPGVPPNLDRPSGTVWRLDVLPNADALPSGLTYAKTPQGSYQDTPEKGVAPALVVGKTYHLAVLKDVGIPLANCLFTYGSTTPPAVVDAGSDASTTSDAGGDFGKSCADDTTCSAPANYCAKSPGATTGYCTQTGCLADPSICPAGWKCFDVSVFSPGGPNFCQKP
jgi:hypothetical protein